MSKVELKPCPFCGGKSWVLKIPNESNKKYVVVCKDDDCGASLGNYSETREKAINAWNRRVTMASCKDCIHEKVCNYFDGDLNEEGAEKCVYFKDCNKFVELPCKVGTHQ